MNNTNVGESLISAAGNQCRASVQGTDVGQRSYRNEIRNIRRKGIGILQFEFGKAPLARFAKLPQVRLDNAKRCQHRNRRRRLRS